MNIHSYLPQWVGRKIRPRQVISHNWEDRPKILQHDVNLFCWTRSLAAPVTRYLEEQVQVSLQPIRCPVEKNNSSQQLSAARAVWEDTRSPEGDLFWKDVHNITRDFLQFSKDGTGTLHLKVVTDDACSKFHVDGYRLRLFTSYLGPGTEWLPEDAVNRHALGTTNEQIVKKPTRFQSLCTGHVGILKGEIPNQNQAVRGIVHRSPPIKDTGQRRLILRVDIE